MRQTFPRLFLGSSTCSSAFCITDMHQHQEMLREGEGCKRQRGRKPGRPQQASVCFGIERKQLVSALPASSIRRALLGERHGCTWVLTHHLQVDTEELHPLRHKCRGFSVCLPFWPQGWGRRKPACLCCPSLVSLACLWRSFPFTSVQGCLAGLTHRNHSQVTGWSESLTLGASYTVIKGKVPK